MCVFVYVMNMHTNFEAVKIRFDAHVMSLIDASVFISAKASHVKLHNLIKPPRQHDNKMSEYIVIPETQPLCELLRDCFSSLFLRSHLLVGKFITINYDFIVFFL